MTDKPILPAVPHQLPTTISLPPSLERLLEQAEISGQTVILRRSLTEAEQLTLSQIASDAERWGNGKADITRSLQQVAKIVSAYPASNLSDAVLEARSEAYMAALEDVPTWAVGAAGKRWARGEVGCLGDKINLSFPPSPPQLRLLALDEVAKVRAVAVRCRRLQSAKVRKEIDPEQRKRAIERLYEVFPPKGSAVPAAMTMDDRNHRLAEMAREVVDDAMGGI